MPKPTFRSFLGVAKDAIHTTLSADHNAGVTTINIVGTGVPASHTIVIVDGPLTEVRAVSAGGGTSALTVAATTNPHKANTYVYAQPTASVGPADYIPVKGDSLKLEDKIVQLADQGLRGSNVDQYGNVQGPRHNEWSFAGDVFVDTFGYLLGALLGAVDFAGGTPNTHTFANKNTGDGQPTPLLLHDFNAINTRVVAAALVEELALKFDPMGKLEYTAKGKGLASGVVTTPTPSYSTLTPVPTWLGLTSVGGSSLLTLVGADLALKRAVAAIHSQDGTQDPYAIFGGALAVEGKVAFVMEDDTQLNNYLNNSQPAVLLTFTRGAGASQEQLQLQMTKANYESSSVNRGKEWVEVELAVKGIANTTDANTAGTGFSPIRAVLKNAKATGTYQ